MENFGGSINQIKLNLNKKIEGKGKEISDILWNIRENPVETKKQEKLSHAERLLSSLEETLSELFLLYLQMRDHPNHDLIKELWEDFTEKIATWRVQIDNLNGNNELATDEVLNENDRNYNNFEELMYDRWLEININIDIDLNTQDHFSVQGYKFDKMLMVLSLLDEKVGISKENTNILKFNNFYMIVFKDLSKTFFVSNNFGKPTYIFEEEVHFSELKKNYLNELLYNKGGVRIFDHNGDTIENFENKLLSSDIIPAGNIGYEVQTMDEVFPELSKKNKIKTQEDKFIKEIKTMYLSGFINDSILENENDWLTFINSNFSKDKVPFKNWETFRKYLESEEQINNHYSTVQLLFQYDNK